MKITVDRDLLVLLRDACWSMKASGGWDTCPLCDTPGPATGEDRDGPFSWHSKDCGFRVGYQGLLNVVGAEPIFHAGSKEGDRG